MKLRFVEREAELVDNVTEITYKYKVKILQYWEDGRAGFGNHTPSQWIDVPLEVEE